MNRTVTRALAPVALVLASVARASAAPHAGDVAPAFDVPSASGGTYASSKFHGKATYLNFFASWCGPCNDEAPDVAKLYAKYHPKGLALVGVDEQEDAGKAKDFATKYKWPFAIVVDGGDMAKAYGAIGLPVHVFIDKRGKISTYRLGEMTPPEIDAAIAKIL